MKKIVALVLSLVMVLGLATTAFAATAAAGGDAATAAAVVDSTAEVKAAAGAVPSAKLFATYQIYLTAKADGAVTVKGPYAELATKDGAEYTYVDGTVIRYFATQTADYTVNVKAVKLTAKTEYDCGDLKPAATGTYYVDEAGNYYTAGGTVVGNADGKMVFLTATTVDVEKHDYKEESKTAADGTTTLTAVVCSECKKSFAFVEGDEAAAIAKFGAGKYDVVTAGALYVAKTGAAVADDAAGETVESAKTFDAGIAMYVGMSVMAAAGSAVVLKKKD